MNLTERILAFNQGRRQDLLTQKLTAMASSPFVFLRGTCHLFYEDWPRISPLNDVPLAWGCGDLHLENFGAFRGDNHLTYFDLNDFDEAALAPCTWDLTRLLTSILVAASTLDLSDKQAQKLCSTVLDSYGAALAAGRIQWVERSVAPGMVGELLETLRERKRVDFLDKRSTVKAGRRSLKLIPGRQLAIDDTVRADISKAVAKFAAKQSHPEFYELLDCAFRVAGTGSRGWPRYILLVAGHGSPDENRLLDVKYSPPGSLTPYLQWPQPQWANDAERVIGVQQRMQAMPPAFLTPFTLNQHAYVMRALQPVEDKLELALWNHDLSRLSTVVGCMGHLLAWAQLRSSGRQGSATADELIAFGSRSDWHPQVLDYARHYSSVVHDNWAEFRASRYCAEATT